MKQKPSIWLTGFLFLVFASVLVIGYLSVKIDPFFHYHKPLTNEYYYTLNNERSQNDGIIKHFDYQGIITGTSMTQCFKTSDAESLWKGVSFIKVPFAGASYKEINDNLSIALQYNPEIKIVIRGLDSNRYADDVEAIQGEYPIYLYDENIFNDVQYIFNRDIFFERVVPMEVEKIQTTSMNCGITSFDDYSNWSSQSKFGRNILSPNGVKVIESGSPVHITNDVRNRIIRNIQENVTSLPEQYPEVMFYYFLTPYGIQRWQTLLSVGTIYSQIESEKIVIEEILKHKNIKLYSFNNETWITTDLNNYTNAAHYGEWINSLMLKYMYEDTCLLTVDNYEEYLEQQLSFYTTFDYSTLNDQEDYIDDYQAAVKIAHEVFSLEGKELSLDSDLIQLSNATIIEDQYNGHPGVLCQGCLQRASTESTVEEYIRDIGYIGAKYYIQNIGPTKFITFYGKKISDAGMPTVVVYDKNNRVVLRWLMNYRNIDKGWHLYYIDVASLQGEATIVFNGGYIDKSSTDSQYVFSNILLY